MNLDKIFPEVTYTTTELNLLAEAMTNPTVVKYLKAQQAACFRAIANGLPGPGQSDSEYLREQAQVVGALNVFEKLLSIPAPASSN